MPGVTHRLGPLGERPFRLLWLGRSSSALGDALVPIALAFAVLDLRGSAADLGLVLAAFTISRVVFILAGGVWADRLPRQLVMIAADAVRAVAQGFLAVVVIGGHVQLWHFVVTAAAVGGAAAFFGPASTGLVPETVSPGRLQQANALLNLSDSGIGIFGPALAGLLVAAVGPGWVFAVDSASFVASACFLLAMRFPTTRAAGERKPFLREALEGLAEVVRRRWLAVSFVSFSISNVSIAVFFVLGPLVFAEELGGARPWGLAMTIAAAGGALGSLVALRVRPRHPLRWSFPIVLFSPLQLVLLAGPAPVVVIGLAGAVAFGANIVANTLWETTVQQQVPRDKLSRVSSLDWMISLVFMPVGFALAGPLAQAIGLRETLIGTAAVGAVAILMPLALRETRAIERTDLAPDGADAVDAAPAPDPV